MHLKLLINLEGLLFSVVAEVYVAKIKRPIINKVFNLSRRNTDVWVSLLNKSL